MIRSRFWSLAAWKIQTHARSPSRRKKKTRKAPRMATVTTPAALSTIWPANPPVTSRVTPIRSCTTGTDDRRDVQRGEIGSGAVAPPRPGLAGARRRTGACASPSSSSAPPTIASATTQTIAAAAVRERPRARSRRAYGAKKAAITMATTIDAVTTQSTDASSHEHHDEGGDDEHAPPERRQVLEPLGDERRRQAQPGRRRITDTAVLVAGSAMNRRPSHPPRTLRHRAGPTAGRHCTAARAAEACPRRSTTAGRTRPSSEARASLPRLGAA